MHYFVVLTTECDLRCRYCYGANLDDLEFGEQFEDMEDVPSEMQYDTSELKRFMGKDPDPTIIFYGGEPLLRTGRLREIMDAIPAKYMLQTNGLGLRRLGEEYAKRLENVMFSIDGDRKITDFYRGVGVYDKVMDNVRWLRSINFSGEVLARMTVQEETDIYKQVRHLLSRPFDSVHWQLNANFWSNDIKNRGFSEWAEGSYNPEISRLVDFWVKRMETGRVLRIYPFVGLMWSMLHDEDSASQSGGNPLLRCGGSPLLRCGAGWAQYAVLTNGRIAPCPVMAGMKEFYVGDLKSDPNGLPKVAIGGQCNSCDIKSICGGRCLFANKTMLWGENGFKLVCGTVRHLISELQRVKPDISRLLDSGKIRPDDFDYPKFNSCEIIP